MNLSAEVMYSLRILGLAPGATAADVRSAFRRLARTCHPDVAGRQGAFRFQQITGAYTFLKGLTPEELKRFPSGEPARRPARRAWPDPFAWYRRRAEQARAEAETARRAERQEEERRDRMRTERIGHILARYEKSLSERWSRAEKEADAGFVGALLLRLGSPAAAVRRLALGRVGALANREEVLQAIAEALCRWEVDDLTARAVAGLQVSPENRKRLAERLCSAGRVRALPDVLIAALLGLRTETRPDPALLERYLIQARPVSVALILRCWPEGRAPSDSTVRHLLDQEDERVLVPLLSILKQRYPTAALRFRSRLDLLSEHPSPAVRVWSRTLKG